MKYDFTTTLVVDLTAPYPLSVSVTGRYLCLIIKIDLSAGYGTPLLKDRGYHTYLATNMSSTPSTGSLHIHKACPPQDSDWGYQHPQLTPIPTQISQTNMEPDQISTTDVSIRSIISSCRRISPLRHRNKYQPM